MRHHTTYELWNHTLQVSLAYIQCDNINHFIVYINCSFFLLEKKILDRQQRALLASEVPTSVHMSIHIAIIHT